MELPESLSQAMLVGVMLVGGLGVLLQAQMGNIYVKGLAGRVERAR